MPIFIFPRTQYENIRFTSVLALADQHIIIQFAHTPNQIIHFYIIVKYPLDHTHTISIIEHVQHLKYTLNRAYRYIIPTFFKNYLEII